MLGSLFASDGGRDLASRLERARAMFGSLGFGQAELSLDITGGTVRLATSQYATGWGAKFGASKTPVCHFAVGYWRGALAAAAGLNPERVGGTEARCAACSDGKPGCTITIEVR